MHIEPITRSAFIVRAGLAVAGAYGATAVGPFVGRALAQGSDVEILQFALTLEFLEAEYYIRALDELDLRGDAAELTQELRDNESQHVETLSALIETLGGTPVAKPRFDFGEAYASTESYLRQSNILEDTGVSAYNGAGPLIQDPAVLAAAGSIVQVEARHAALVRLLRDKPPAPNPFDVASTEAEVREAVAPFVVS
jgi:rubrerythrin